MAGPDIVEMLRHHWDGQRNTEYACCTSIGDAAAETIAALRVALDEARAISDRDARDIAALRALVAALEAALRYLIPDPLEVTVSPPHYETWRQHLELMRASASAGGGHEAAREALKYFETGLDAWNDVATDAPEDSHHE